ncbi:MAG: DNA polymerase domain-containing protein [Candidatus Hydrothermarchaeaceae archaeon]
MRGWILDLYPSHDKMTVWLKDEKGRTTRLIDAFAPVFYVSSEKQHLDDLIGALASSPGVRGFRYDGDKRTIYGERPENLLRVEATGHREVRRLAARINEMGELSRYRLYDVDIRPELRYLFENGISPMLPLKVEGTLDGLRYEVMEDKEDLHYPTPSLREAHLEVEGKKRGRIAKMSDTIENITIESEETITIEGDEASVLTDLVRALKKLDPDVIYTDGGDSFELPYLYHRASANDLNDFHLGREPERSSNKAGRTFFTYGRVVYKPPTHELRGRVHIDTSHFLTGTGGTQGLIDLSRFAGRPMQMLSRMSPGNAITTMQLRHAHESGILAPWKRQGCEYFKSAWRLLHSDRGGYIFDPKVGIYDDVAELDFASMYPNIMVKHNISPETVLCGCCQDSNKMVPVLDYHVCEKKVGLVPQVLEPMIERRMAYKRMMKSADGEDGKAYEQRQSLLKWLLITSFGYQGYRNARFGRIESHESICAIGRELLLRAKEVAEYFDFEVLHGLVDSLWVRREASVEDLEELCEIIAGETGIDISLEGRYSWIVFLPDRSTRVGALNRYYGLFEDGELKVRGIETRMRNTPRLIKDFQGDFLGELAKARNIEEFHATLPKAFKVMRRYVEELRDRNISPEDLVYRVSVSKGLDDYRVKNFSSIALKQLRREGIELSPGQSVRYVVTDHGARRHGERVKLAEACEDGDGYDAEFYTKQILRATESLLLPFGYTVERLEASSKGTRADQHSRLH